MDAATAGSGSKEKRTHHRSPAYPMLNLEEAIEKSRMIYNEDKRSFTSRAVIVKHLGYKDENSGIGNRELAALRQYGLLEERLGQFGISERAYAVLFLSENSEERRTQVSQAALAPTVFREIWTKYGADASDETLKDYLIHHKKFNPTSVVDVVKNYKATISFAKPTGVTYTGEEESEQEHEDKMDATQTPDSPSILKSATPTPPLKVQRVTEPEGAIATPVGKDGDRVVFAHVRFDSGIRKEFVTSLKKYLDYLETTLN
jgi:hypothetical protein